ncbi:MFS transporter [Pseudactinotalea suaedae]|uniref:MFS transporter n=1 Tax=Pseudactinotalea suaedae TaxID=1524924 RepID=UPI001391803A|nr:MFS transporter [Pseudactinotalea suaedae]
MTYSLHRRRAPLAEARPWTPRQWAALVCVLAGYVVGTLTTSGTAIALPTIATELRAGPAGMQWFVTGYLLAATCLVLVAGALGDRYGRRLVLRISSILYTAGMVGAALAQDIVSLDAARILSGVGSAGLMACGAAVLASSFDGVDRVRAFALCGTAGGIGMAFGPTAAGWIVAQAGWRGTFVVLAAVSVLMVVSTYLIEESRAAQPRRLDVAGAVLLTIGLSLLLLGISTGTASGFTVVVVGELVVACLVLAAFVVRCLRVAEPLLDLALVKNREVAGWLLASVMGPVGLAGFTVYLPTYLLTVRGVEAGPAGTWMLAFTVPIFVTPMLASRWVTRGGSPARAVALALGLMSTGLFALAALATNPAAWAILVPTALLGVASGTLTGLCDAQLMSRAGSEHVGMMSGLLNTVRTGVTSIVLGVFGGGLAVAIGRAVGGGETADRLATGDVSGLDPEVAVSGFGSGWAAVVGVNGVVIAAVAAVFVMLLRGRRRPARADRSVD